MTNDQNTRRNFLRKAAASVGVILSASAAASILASCESDETQPTTPTETYAFDVTTLPALANVGGIDYATISGLNQGLPVLITRVEQNLFAVFSSICTHQGCQVGLPSSPGQNCICPCHLSEFSSTNGHIVKQPNVGSATNLPSFASTFNASTNILTING